MNFHYQKNPNTDNLVRELREIEADLQNKHKLLQQKRKLQQQFYEDQYTKPTGYAQGQPQQKNMQNLDLADEVMKQLLMGNNKNSGKPSYQPIYQPYRNQEETPNPYKQQIFQKPSVPQLPQRQNPQMIQNKRQLEKQKLQNQNMADDYPFGKFSGSKERRNVVHSPPKKQFQMPEKDNYPQIPINKNQRVSNEEPYQNPFTRGEQLLKRKREEEERNYRRVLEQQMAEQKRKKSIEKQRYRDDAGLKVDNYGPYNQPEQRNQQGYNIPPPIIQNEPFVHKRRDPNGSPPKYDLSRNQSADDIKFMNMQVLDLKTKLNKGRINQEEYQRQMKKLQKHYGKKIYEHQQPLQRYSPKKRPQNSEPQTQQKNPFVKNEEFLKQKKQQQERNYRKVLEEQMQEQKRLKDLQKEKYKQEYNENFNNYVPNTATAGAAKSPEHYAVEQEPFKKKKRDPNGDFPKYTIDNQSGGDLNFMRMQVSELKMKLGKGRISHEEYERDIKKLQQHYGRKVQQLEQQVNKPKESINDKYYEEVPAQKQRSQSYPEVQDKVPEQDFRQRMNFNGRYPTQQPQIQQSQYIDQMRMHSPNSPQFTNQSAYSNNANTNSEVQFQMMLKLFEGLKEIIQLQQKSQESMLSEKKFLEETFSKFNPYLFMNTLQMHQMNMNPSQINQLQNLQQQQLSMLHNMQPSNYPNNSSTQQVPPNIHHNSANRQFQTDKKYNNYDKNSYQKQMIGGSASSIHHNQQGDSDNSISYSYLPSNIDKSLSAVVNKIPLTSKQKDMEMDTHHQDIVRFYSKKYKVVPCREFEYFEVESMDKKKQIPSVSKYLQTEDAEQELDELFEADMKKYKKFQKQKQLEMIKSKLESSRSQNFQQQQQHNKNSHTIEQADKKIKQKNKPLETVPQNKKYYEKPAFSQNRQEQRQIQNPFLKKHVSNNSDYQQMPTFHEQNHNEAPFNPPFSSFQSPVTNYKEMKSAEILQQEEYQTEPRKPSPERVSHPRPSTKGNKNEKDKDHPSLKILNVMRSNNQLLNKYLQTPSPYRKEEIQSANSIQQSINRQQDSKRRLSQGKESISSKQYESRQYFESKDISPVQHRQYESSLETVRSEEDNTRRSNMDLMIAGLPSASALRSSNVQESQGSFSQQSPQRLEENERESSPEPRYAVEYCATVESVQESASKLPTFLNKPPIHRKLNKLSGRKKEGVIRMNTESIFKSNLSGIPSEGSRQKIGSSLMKPPTYAQQNLSNVSGAQFDSNVYESQYEQSIQRDAEQLKPSFKKECQAEPKLIEISNQSQESKESQKIESQSQSQPIAVSTQPKWKSLEEARKIAREFRQKSGDDNSRKSVQEKLSEFESFIHSTKRKDESILSKREGAVNSFADASDLHSKSQLQNYQKKTNKKTTEKKKNIMDILDGLQNEGDNDYQMDFESYREESER